MADTGLISRLPIGPLASRPRLVGAILAGAACALVLGLAPDGLRPGTRAVVSWDAACVWFVVASVQGMVGRKDDDIRARARAQDDGRHLILGLVVVCAAASLGAIAMELSLAKNAHGPEKGLRVALAFGTVALSWFVVQLIFAFHYAHEYYTSKADGGDIQKGLGFPGDEAPDYWDFVYFAVIIGVASQTADVSFTSKPLRRTGTVHGVLAFTFNTVVLALTINLLASLF